MGKRRSKKKSNQSGRHNKHKWVNLPDADLLDVRLCDLHLKIAGTRLQENVERLYDELDARGLHFRPHFWLSSEWFTPDGVPGVAIPFYLAHPRLMQLERSQMLEVEGGTRKWCMQLIRHEVGHAIDNAFRLRRRKKYHQIFGKSSQPYPDYYQPKPFSRRFVLHLDYWYAQSHPTEDFAETFAVWLTPGSQWHKRYKGWSALRKLQYVDELMTELDGKKPPVNCRERAEPLSSLSTTLREHYAEKRERYGVDYPEFYSRDLRRLFSDKPEHRKNELASRFLRRIRPEIRKLVAEWTGQYQYTIDQVLLEMIQRAGEFKLRVDRPDEQVRLEAAILLSIQTMNYLHGGHHRLAV